MTARDAAPLVDWLEPLMSDSDFPERTAEVGAVLDRVQEVCGEIARIAGDNSPEVAFYVGCIESAVFGPYSGVEIEVAE